MNIYTKFILTTSAAVVLAACSPPEPPSENFLEGQRRSIDKAKNVEKVILEQSKKIDQTIDQSTGNQ